MHNAKGQQFQHSRTLWHLNLFHFKNNLFFPSNVLSASFANVQFISNDIYKTASIHFSSWKHLTWWSPRLAQSLFVQKGLAGLCHEGAFGQRREICIKVVSLIQPLFEAVQHWKGHSPTWQCNPNGELLSLRLWWAALFSWQSTVKEWINHLLLVQLRQLAAHSPDSLPHKKQDNYQPQTQKVLHEGVTTARAPGGMLGVYHSRQRFQSPISTQERGCGSASRAVPYSTSQRDQKPFITM